MSLRALQKGTDVNSEKESHNLQNSKNRRDRREISSGPVELIRKRDITLTTTAIPMTIGSVVLQIGSNPQPEPVSATPSTNESSATYVASAVFYPVCLE